MRVISRLNSNKQVEAEVVGALKVENKVWLIFVPGKKHQKNVCQVYIEILNQQVSYRSVLRSYPKKRRYGYWL